MPTVLVTGAARGIGRATALHLAAAGWDVVAGVRRREDGDGLAAERVTPIVLDVTDADQVAALPAALPGGLDAVVNNAGVVVSGPMEGVPLDDLRRQLEVNVVGQVAVTQAVLPLLRAVARARGVRLVAQRAHLDADDRPVQRVEVRARGPGRRAAPGAAPVGDRRRARRARADRHRHVAVGRRRARGVRGRADARPPRALRPPHRGRAQDDPAVAEAGDPGGGRRGDDRARAHGAPPARPLRRRHRPAGAGGALAAHADARARRGAARRRSGVPRRIRSR